MLTYTIKFVNDDVLVDYDGMNCYAAKQIGYDRQISQGEIFINEETLTKPEMIKTIVHEIVESIYMSQGYQYWQAHELAAKAETNQDNISQISSIFEQLYK